MAIYTEVISRLRDCARRIGVARNPMEVREEIESLANTLALWDSIDVPGEDVPITSPGLIRHFRRAAKEQGELFVWCLQNLKGFPPAEGQWIDEVKQRLAPPTVRRHS